MISYSSCGNVFNDRGAFSTPGPASDDLFASSHCPAKNDPTGGDSVAILPQQKAAPKTASFFSLQNSYLVG
jgi:hypothetical protein